VERKEGEKRRHHKDRARAAGKTQTGEKPTQEEGEKTKRTGREQASSGRQHAGELGSGKGQRKERRERKGINTSTGLPGHSKQGRSTVPWRGKSRTTGRQQEGSGGHNVQEEARY